MLAAGALLLLLDGQPGLLLLQPRGIVALPGNPLAPVQFENPLGDVVEEIAVVGDENDGARVFRQVPFEPGHALGVEMVGGLVEQQDVGTFEQYPAKRHPATLAAGKSADIGITRRQPHGIHGDLDPAVEIPAAGGFDGILHAGLLLEQRVHLIGVGPLAQAGIDLVEPRQVAPQGGHGLFDIAPNIECRVECRLLGHIADGGPGRWSGGADEVIVEPGHDTQQRALARPVPADDTDLGPRVKREPDVLEHFLLGVSLR